MGDYKLSTSEPIAGDVNMGDSYDDDDDDRDDDDGDGDRDSYTFDDGGNTMKMTMAAMPNVKMIMRSMVVIGA